MIRLSGKELRAAINAVKRIVRAGKNPDVYIKMEKLAKHVARSSRPNYWKKALGMAKYFGK